jgi:HEAT repeat protein
MKRLLIIVAVIAAACSFAAADEDIKLDLALGGSQFEVGELISYQVTFTNTTEQDAVLYVDSAAAGAVLDCTLDVRDESGKTVSGHFGTSRRAGTSGALTIAAGKSGAISDVLNRWAAVSKPGKYTVRAVWSPRVSPWPPYTLFPPTEDAARTESKEVQFTVVAPTQEGKDKRLAEAIQSLKDAKTRQQKATAIRTLGLTLDPRVVPELVKVSRQTEVMSEVELAFARFATIESGSELGASITDALMSDLEKNGPCESHAILLTRFSISSDRLVPVLVEWAKNGKDKQKADAFITLSVLGRPALKPELKSLMISSLDSNSTLVRRCALVAIGSARFDGTLDRVIYVAKADKEPLVRSQAAAVLAFYQDQRAVPILIEMLKDSSDDVVRSALGSLAYIGGDKAQMAIDMFIEAKSGYLRQVALDARKQMREEGTGKKEE